MIVPERIKYLSLKWKKGTLTEIEKVELNNWYNRSLPEFIELDGEDDQHVKTLLFQKIRKELGNQDQQETRRFPLWMKVAASVTLFLGISVLAYQNFYTSSTIPAKQLIVTASAIKRIILPDSSIVWVKGNSKLIYPATFGKHQREVTLIGEALFEIKHDQKHPFVVKAGQYETTVLGTSFNLKSDPSGQEFDLAVLTGKVGVVNRSPGNGVKVVFVSANQTFKVIAGKMAATLIERKQDIVSSVTAGTQYNMGFEKTPFEEIMHRFEQKFDVHFEGYTGEYKSCRITADLTDQSLEQSLKILCSSINATYKVHDNKIQLTGGGCFDE
jgi:transmembrane sensor